MELLPLDRPSAFELVAGWLGEPDNARWLDFGPGVPPSSPDGLMALAERGGSELRLFTDESGEPIGLVALTDIDRRAATASPWFVLGDKARARQGFATRAVAKMLTYGFDELGIGAVSAWTLETNEPSIQLLRRLSFRFVGRLRRCHAFGDEVLDRLLFDLLAEEHTDRRPERHPESESLRRFPFQDGGSGVVGMSRSGR